MSPAAVPVYPFVRSAFDAYGIRTAPALAIVVHMAEGGNTVNYLHRPIRENDGRRGVSVHFVIEKSGRTVQMLDLARVSGSINPNDLRATTDYPFTGYNREQVTFGARTRKAVLGKWERNPNQAVISIEVEGFAKDGPNEAQRIALRRLSRDLVKRLPTIKGLLGHRDFTSRKACPGHHINWAGMVPIAHHG